MAVPNPGGCLLEFKDGRTLQLADMCNTCDQKAIIEFLDKPKSVDRELLQLAAKAAGITIAHFHDHFREKDGMAWGEIIEGDRIKTWSPLYDDGDALRLAVKLQLTICNEQISAGVVYCTRGDDELGRVYTGPLGDDVQPSDYRDTRLSIVSAAAAIGEMMP